MGEITDFVNLYIENSDILEEKTNEIAFDLQNNIRKQAPYDQGRLRRSIRVDTRITPKVSLITGYYDEGNADYGEYVLRGIRGKKEVAPIDFLGDGLQRTLEAYK